MSITSLWDRFKEHFFWDEGSGFSCDVSRMKFAPHFFSEMQSAVEKAFDEMGELEKGAIANRDEQRMVGHYWLRRPSLAPTEEIREQIVTTVTEIKRFAADVQSGAIASARGDKFRYALIIGIGGSALGPQFVYRALGARPESLQLFFFDNTDPDGMEVTLRSIPDLSRTLCIVISKSGGTKETRNGQLVAAAAMQSAGVKFERHFVAVTSEGSELFKTATSQRWLRTFPMWDWVGGRTSELSAVGLLPAALHGVNVDELLRGAGHMDELTRQRTIAKNPAALLALMWHHAGEGAGRKAMVVLPYNDRIELFSKYLQQLVMESLGKRLDRSGKTVHQGLSVYGNKGSTDQHAYVQQLRDGLNNFFVVFVEVLRDRARSTTGGSLPTTFSASDLEVDPEIVCGDYLSGFLQGTRKALYESDRESITITIPEVSEFSIGMLIALFERAVGLYASLVNVNAYHQPGVEAGKKAATEVLDLQRSIVKYLKNQAQPALIDSIAQGVGGDPEAVFKVLTHLVANGRAHTSGPEGVFQCHYRIGSR